jgi:hypothetical protein
VNSHIFSLPFDASAGLIEIPSGQLNPLFPIKGTSVRPMTSADGKYVAFLNAHGGGTYVFNLILAEAAGRVLQEIRTDGIGFSRPAFVGQQTIANPTVTGSGGDRSDVLFELDFSNQSLRALDRASLKFNEGQ